MISAKQRLMSHSYVEKAYGAIFYILLAVSAYLGYWSYIHASDVYSAKGLEYLKWFAIGYTYFIIFSTIGVFADYGNPDKEHKGSIRWYLAILNPTRKSFIHALRSSKKYKPAFYIFNGVLGLLWYVTLLISFGGSVYPLLTMLYVVFISFISLKLSQLGLRNVKVTPEQLNAYEDIEGLSKESKDFFRVQMVRIIEKDKRVNKKHVFRFFKDVIPLYANLQKSEDVSFYDSFVNKKEKINLDKKEV